MNSENVTNLRKLGGAFSKIIFLHLDEQHFPKGHSFFRDSFLMLSSETIPKGTLYTWRGSTDANFGAKMILKVYITIPRGFFDLVRLIFKGGLY